MDIFDQIGVEEKKDIFDTISAPDKSKDVFDEITTVTPTDSKDVFDEISPPEEPKKIPHRIIQPKPVQQEPPWKAKHPTLYGVGGATYETGKTLAKSFMETVPWIKFFTDPKEKDRFNKLSMEDQEKEISKEAMKCAYWLLAAPTQAIGSAVLKRYAPGVYTFLTKARHLPKLAPKAKLIGKEAVTEAVPAILKKEATKIKPETVLSQAEITFPALKWKATKAGYKTRPTPEFWRWYYTIGKEKASELGIKASKSKIGRWSISNTGKKIPIVKGETIIPQSPAVQTLLKAIKKSKTLRKQQDAIYAKVKDKQYSELLRLGETAKGEAGFRSKLRMMEGKMKQVQYESLQKAVNQKTKNALYQQIEDCTAISTWDKLPAGKGLAKLFGEYGGVVPTNNEIELLHTAFGDEFVKALLKKRSVFQKMINIGYDVGNVSRAMMSSADLSMAGRQAIFFVGRPKRWLGATAKQHRFFVSERAYQEYHAAMRATPVYRSAMKHKLSLTSIDGPLSNMEEKFMSKVAQKIPIVRPSARAHTGGLNKIRLDVFKDFMALGQRMGCLKDPKYLDDAARYINVASGRGGLGKLEVAAEALNTGFFAPRLWSGRFQLMNPWFYYKLHPVVRKEALKDLFKFSATALSTVALASIAGVKVIKDARNSDFLKLKFGNVRYDFLSTFAQPIRLVTQLYTGEVVSPITGDTIELSKGYKPLTKSDLIMRYLEFKLSPMFSFGAGLLRGRTSLGERFDVPTEVANRFIPMVVQDMIDLYNEEGITGLPMSIPAVYGIGVQTFGGVKTFGLKGKDYPLINDELMKLKISMGYPTNFVYGIELTNDEYKKCKKQTGFEIAKSLNKIMTRPGYHNISEIRKVKIIEKEIDHIKERVKIRMFPEKKKLSLRMRRIKETTLLDTKAARELAIKQLEEMGRQRND